MDSAVPELNILNRLALRIDPDARVLICCRPDCRYALSVKGSAVTTHLRVKHQVDQEERKGLTEFLRGLGQSYLGDPSVAPLPKDGSPEHPDLRVWEGYACRKCPFRTTNFSSLTRHISTRYFQAQPPGQRELDDFYDEVWLQAWTAGSNQSRRYWIISRVGLSIRASDGVQAHLASIKEQERARNGTGDTSALKNTGGIAINHEGDLVRFEEQTPWIERTGWDKTYRGKSRDVLSALAAVSFSRLGSNPYLIGQCGTNGLHEDIVSTVEDERRIAAILEAMDALLDRCEETARKTSRSILCWLRSTQALTGYPKPFVLVHHSSSKGKYRVLFKRCLVLLFRSYRMDPSTRERLTGIRFKRKQLRFLEAIWNHGRMPRDDSEEEYEEHDEEDDMTESSGEDDECWSDEDQVVRDTGMNSKRTGNEQASEELLELLLGLSLSLCTEPVTDGQPSSTLLVFFSGILGFSSSSRAFLPAKSYTPYLSGLLYIQRLLFLEMALPLREYPTLKISQRPHTKQLERLEVVRKKYMVVGSQSAFEEMISLRSYGRVIARSESPAYLLRWSEDGQTVYYGDLFHDGSTPEELMFGWDRSVDLSQVKDDLKNAERGFSFVTHPGNNLEDAYLELCERACTARRDSLSPKGNWNQKAVFKYLRTEEALCDYLSLGLYHLCGQGPRWPDLSSLTCVNGEWGMRGIFVYNGSMIYLVRHHKAKRSTNREFVVVRYLPAQLGQTLCQYLVFIRRFVDLLDRQCHLGFSEQGRSSPLLFRVRTMSGPKPWPSGRLTAVLKAATSKVWNKPVNSQLFRQLCIGITEKHVREIHRPFNRFDDTSQNADCNVIFAWQSGHRPLQRGTTYGLDGAFPTGLQPQLLHAYEWAFTP
ncbi:hypothetical protein B0J15DRAFT_562897 [Fusarium solani]|uniref:Uncharacterized protein n=1 Tax=Fusarium solani TaxID=169388 RepID=A0A9P9GZJ5_FUSSL|nr:uncharacterized protein B0J15DRAFT_562897 [Fusarium solani]KAH7248434.1 hypothetical protein B0J15DRAFT_562897 [Fusarium solani]